MRLLLRAGGVGRSYNGWNMDTGVDAAQLVSRIQAWGQELSFSQIGVAGVDLSAAEPGLQAWLDAGFHGSMAYMARHGMKRARPGELVPGTLSVVTARMDYLPRATPEGWQDSELQRLNKPGEAVVSVYARGRDYHKVLRSRLQTLADRIALAVGPLGHRVFTDSAPVLEAELASRSGLGWRGKHTLVLSRDGGSMCFLGEIYLDLALPPTPPVSEHCGACSACISACPTGAILGPHRLDARRCISYLTIEHDGPIPLALRPLMGNRIYGCDDCQLVCPWNKFAQRSPLPDFDAREGLVGATLVDLFAWTEAEFLRRTEGSPIRRIGHERWLRNLAVALGNALRAERDPDRCSALRQALASRCEHPGDLVREHVAWAMAPQAATGCSDEPVA
jgi:epoxyqueuosine reductase